MKQDMNGVRTAQDLEQKYDFNGIKELKDQTEINRQEIISTNKELKDFVENVTDDLGKLQNQIDGNITTYFDSGVPTLSNFPANEWVTDTDKNNHLGDLYYDKDTGYSYRFTLEKDGYKWIKLTDSDVTEALAIANSAKDTADKKRRVFLEQPKPPYDNGDMWIKDQEIWICQISKQEGVFEERDFINNLKYTDDTKANEVDGKLTVVSGTVAEIQKGVNEISSTLTETQKLVDKNGKEIGIVGEQVTKLTQTTEGLSASVSQNATEIENITTTTQTSKGGNTLHIEKSLKSDALGYDIEGNSYQETRKGYNLITKDGFSTPKSDTSFWGNLGANFTPLTDGWCKQEYTGQEASKWSNSFIKTSAIDVKPNTTYTLFLEIRNSTSNVSLGMSSSTADDSMFQENVFSIIGNGIHKFLVKTKSNLSNKYLRSYSRLENKNSAKIEYRLMIVEGDKTNEDLPYQHYGTMPSPDFPSEIDVVKGYNILNLPYNINNKLTDTATKNDYHVTTDYYATLETNKTYTFDMKTDGEYDSGGQLKDTVEIFLLKDKEGKSLVHIKTLPFTFKPPANGNYYIRYDINMNGKKHSFWDFQLKEGSSKPYIPHNNIGIKVTNGKEETITNIDLSKSNLFDKNNYIESKLYGKDGKFLSASTMWSFIYDVSKLSVISISKVSSTRFGVFASNEYPIKDGNCVTLKSHENNDTQFTCDVSNYNYITVPFYFSLGDTLTKEQILDSIRIYESENADSYYELAKVGETTDILNIDSDTSILKRIGKINNYNGETISTPYISTTGRLTRGATIYYILETPQIIKLSNATIPLFSGINNIELLSTLDTNTSIKFLRETPISNEYATNQQLNSTNENLNKTNDLANKNSSDINDTNINLNNNYYNKGQVDSITNSTKEDISQIKKEVATKITSEDLNIAVTQLKIDGVSSVKTATGYTFDKDGLKIKKSDSEMSSILDNDGLSVKRNDTEVLKVRSDGVEAENIKVRTYFTIGTNTRVEDYKDGTGFFFIGGV